MKTKYGEVIQSIYMGFGFPALMLDAEVKEQSQSQEDYQKLFRKKQKEDEERARQAVFEMQQQEASNGSSNGAPTGPLTIGITIKNEEVKKLEEIIDEERRVAVEGFVFDAEIKELRSGRTLLTFKITDYTDSILVKMFSSDKEDAGMIDRVKKGMWARVRGSVQNDTFVRDLVMMANDINEIRPKGRLDTAPEGEKRVELHFIRQ